MALQFSTTYRDNLLDELETTIGQSAVIQIYSGAIPSSCATAASGTLLAEVDLAASGDWNAASGGTKTLASLPLSTTGQSGAGSGTAAGYFRIYESTKTTCHVQGTVTATGGGGDMTLNNNSIASGQTFDITGFTLTAPGA